MGSHMRKFLLLAPVLTLAACDLSSDFTLPEMAFGEAFKEDAPAADTSAVVSPADDVKWKRVDEKAHIEEVAWWRMLNMPPLDALMELAMKDNPSLEVASQRVAAARGTAEVSGASLWPSLELGFGPARQKPADATINATMPPGFGGVTTKPYTMYTAQGVISYELDLFGKNRNTAYAADRAADAEENNYLASRLALQAELAQAYIERAALMAEAEVLEQTLKTQRRTLGYMKDMYDAGAIDTLSMSRGESQLASVEADHDAVAQALAANEHRLATLVGLPPSQFTAQVKPLSGLPPIVPAGLPARLLERRPDVQAAAYSIAAANARIGAARAGYFPDISLSAAGGYSSTEMGDLFKKPAQFWSLGPLAGATLLTQPIFEGGRLSGTLAARNAEYNAAAANYRAVALQAFREVEDGLSNVRHLANQGKARATAVGAADRAFNAADMRYKTGYSSHLDYLDAERTLLAARRADAQVLGQRYIATIQLVRALGGTWQAAPVAPAEAPQEPVKQVVPTAASEPQKEDNAAPQPAATPAAEETPAAVN